jgi:hypothetical protein
MDWGRERGCSWVEQLGAGSLDGFDGMRVVCV